MKKILPLFFSFLFFLGLKGDVLASEYGKIAIYTNVRYGYFLQYPYSWKINAEDPSKVKIFIPDISKNTDDIGIFSVSDVTLKPTPKKDLIFSINIFPNPDNLILEYFVDMNDRCLSLARNNCKLINSTYDKFASLPEAIHRTYKFEQDEAEHGSYYLLDVDSEGKSRFIELDYDFSSGSKDDEDYYKEVKDTLISTFGLLNKQKTTDWPLFYDSKLRYKLNYPLNWFFKKTDTGVYLSDKELKNDATSGIFEVFVTTDPVSSRQKYWEENLGKKVDSRVWIGDSEVPALKGYIDSKDSKLAEFNGTPVFLAFYQGEDKTYEFVYKNIKKKGLFKIDLNDYFYFIRPIFKDIVFLTKENIDAFSDISLHSFNKAINFVSEKGIVTGYSDGTYRPDLVINRSELLKIILESKGEVSDSYSSEKCFKDVTSYMWYTKYVCYAKAQGIVKGYMIANRFGEMEEFFMPEKEVNFVEALKMTAKSYSLAYDEQNSVPWYSDLVSKASEKKFIPSDVSAFDQSFTRAEMAEMMIRVIKSQDGSLDSYLSQTTNGYCSKTPSFEDIMKKRQVCSI